MAETTFPKAQDTTGTLNNVDVYSLTNSNIQEAVVIGDGVNAGRIATIDSLGRIGVVASTGANGTRTTQTVTTVSTTTAFACTGYQQVLLNLIPTSLTAFAATFQGSEDGGTTWFSILARQVASLTVVATSTAVTTSAQWMIFCGGLTHIRLNVTSITGTNMVVALTPTSADPVPTPIPATQPVSGNVSLAVVTNGVSVSRLNSAATTNATSVKTSAAAWYGCIATNGAASARYLKYYNKASAPTVGTDTPFLTIILPAGSTTSIDKTIGINFFTGLAFAITGAVADTDTTAVAAGDVLLTTLYN